MEWDEIEERLKGLKETTDVENIDVYQHLTGDALEAFHNALLEKYNETHEPTLLVDSRGCYIGTNFKVTDVSIREIKNKPRSRNTNRMKPKRKRK